MQVAPLAHTDPWDALVKAWPAIVLAALGALWPALRGWRARRQKESKLHAQDRKNVRYLLDAQRQLLEAILGPYMGRGINMDELRRHQVLISEVCEETWIADGHPPRARRRGEGEEADPNVIEVLKRTQAIQRALERDAKAKTERFAQVEVETFKDGWRGDDTGDGPKA